MNRAPLRSSSTFLGGWSYPWLVVGLLFPVALLNYLDRQMLAAMKTSVIADIPQIDSGTDWGLLPAAFKWVYAFLSPFGGYLADRFGRRHVIALSLLVWSAVTWATGQVDTFQQLLFTRALMGISEACYIPAALALIADYHAGTTRSRAVGIHQMGMYVGVMLGGFSGYVADAPELGWRFAFAACGLVGMAYAFPLWFFLRDAAPATTPTENVATRSASASSLNGIVELLANRNYVFLVLCFTLPAMAGWIVKDWMPSILQDKFNINQGVAGVSAALYVNLAAFGGVMAGGWLADRWSRQTERGRIYVSATGIFLLIPALFGVGWAGSLVAAISFLIVFGLGWGFFDCNNMPILCQIAHPHLRATGYGIMNLVSISVGAFADIGFGYLQDQHVPLTTIFGVFALPALVSVFLMLAIRPPRIADRDDAR